MYSLHNLMCPMQARLPGRRHQVERIGCRTTFHCMSMRLVALSAVSGRLSAATMPCAIMFRNHLPAACAACAQESAQMRRSFSDMHVTRHVK